MPTERQVFERLFFSSNPDGHARSISDLALLGLFTYYKWDHAIKWEEQNGGQKMSFEELQRYEESEARFRELQEKIMAGLQWHVQQVRPVEADLAAAVRKALDEHEKDWSASRFWWGVWQNVVGGIAFAIFIGLILFAAERGAIDLPGIEIRTASSGLSATETK